MLLVKNIEFVFYKYLIGKKIHVKTWIFQYKIDYLKKDEKNVIKKKLLLNFFNAFYSYISHLMVFFFKF
jgi:hypothetical protein